jgi:hypothetical protein
LTVSRFDSFVYKLILVLNYDMMVSLFNICSFQSYLSFFIFDPYRSPRYRGDHQVKNSPKRSSRKGDLHKIINFPKRSHCYRACHHTTYVYIRHLIIEGSWNPMFCWLMVAAESIRWGGHEKNTFSIIHSFFGKASAHSPLGQRRVITGPSGRIFQNFPIAPRRSVKAWGGTCNASYYSRQEKCGRRCPAGAAAQASGQQRPRRDRMRRMGDVDGVKRIWADWLPHQKSERPLGNETSAEPPFFWRPPPVWCWLWYSVRPFSRSYCSHPGPFDIDWPRFCQRLSLPQSDCHHWGP